MKLGQILKNSLNELSKATWEYKNLFFYGRRWVLETTVDPIYSHAVEILIRNGLQLLHNNNQYTHIRCDLNNEIYTQLISSYEENHPLATDFFPQLETAIHHYVEQLSLNWVKSRTTIEEIILPARDVDNDGSEMIILEHPTVGDSDILLRTLAHQYGYYPDMLSITTHTIHSHTVPRKEFIIGKEEFVLKFISIISTDLSPLNYLLEENENHFTEVKLKDLCTKAIARYSLFYANGFSFDSLYDYGLPEALLTRIEDESMEHVQNSQDMRKYRGKIIIFQTTSFYLGSHEGYLIYPHRENIKVGLLNNMPQTWGGYETGYDLNILLSPSKNGSVHALTTSKLKYSNFNVRSAQPSELTRIKDALDKNEARFGCAFEHQKIMEIIEKQMDERPKLAMTARG